MKHFASLVLFVVATAAGCGEDAPSTVDGSGSTATGQSGDAAATTRTGDAAAAEGGMTSTATSGTTSNGGTTTSSSGSTGTTSNSSSTAGTSGGTADAGSDGEVPFGNLAAELVGAPCASPEECPGGICSPAFPGNFYIEDGFCTVMPCSVGNAGCAGHPCVGISLRGCAKACDVDTDCTREGFGCYRPPGAETDVCTPDEAIDFYEG